MVGEVGGETRVESGDVRSLLELEIILQRIIRIRVAARHTREAKLVLRKDPVKAMLQCGPGIQVLEVGGRSPPMGNAV